MSTPDFTPEGIAALILGALMNAVVLLGLDLTAAQEGAISGLITTGTLVAFLVHSAVIRRGRAHAIGLGAVKRDDKLHSK